MIQRIMFTIVAHWLFLLFRIMLSIIFSSTYYQITKWFGKLYLFLISCLFLLAACETPMVGTEFS